MSTRRAPSASTSRGNLVMSGLDPTSPQPADTSSSPSKSSPTLSQSSRGAGIPTGYQGPDRRTSPPRVSAMIESMEFQGPIPPPGLLQAYEDVCPGAAERIIALAEKEQSFGHQITGAALDAESKQNRRGQVCAVIVALSAFACAGFLGFVGAHASAAIVGGTTVVSLVTAFVVGRSQHKQEDEKPVPQSSQPGPQKKKAKKGARG